MHISSQVLKKVIAAAVMSIVASLSFHPSSNASDYEWKDLYNQADSAEMVGNYARAEQKFKQSLSVAEKQSLDMEIKGRILARLARLYVDRKRFKEAEPLTRQAISIASNPRLRGQHHGELLVSLDDLSDAYLDSKRKGLSEEYVIKMVVDICDKPFNGTHRDLLARIRSLACFYIETDRFDQAEPLVARVLNLVKNHHKRNSSARLELIRIASSYRRKGKTAKADLLDQQAKTLAETDKSKRYPSMPYDAQRALVLYNDQRYKDAKPLIVKSIHDVEKREGPGSRTLIQLFEIQAKIMAGLKEYQLADQSMQKSIALQRKHNTDEWIIADTIKLRAEILMASGRKKEADILLKQAKDLKYQFYFGEKGAKRTDLPMFMGQ